MIAFKITINETHTRLIGVDKPDSLYAILNASPFENETFLSFDLGGYKMNTAEYIKWPDLPAIQVGDKISIEIVEVEQVDTPASRKTIEQIKAEDEIFLKEMEAERKARFAAQGLPLPEEVDPSMNEKFNSRKRPDDDGHYRLPAPWEV